MRNYETGKSLNFTRNISLKLSGYLAIEIGRKKWSAEYACLRLFFLCGSGNFRGMLNSKKELLQSHKESNVNLTE